MQDTFGLHDLAVEDAQSFHLRPKVEAYEGGITFVVLRTARYVDEREEVEFGEVSIFVGPGFIITVRQGVASDLHDARLRLEAHPKLLEEGPGRGPVGDPGQDRRRLRAGRRGARRGHRRGREARLRGRARPDPADLPAAARGHRLLPRRAPAARARGGDHPGRRAGHQRRAAPVLPRRRRPPEARQRGDHRPARPAVDDPAGQHGGHRAPSRTRSCARSPAGRRSSPSRRSSRPSTA